VLSSLPSDRDRLAQGARAFFRVATSHGGHAQASLNSDDKQRELPGYRGRATTGNSDINNANPERGAGPDCELWSSDLRSVSQ
jgi:hypothetical protein